MYHKYQGGRHLTQVFSAEQDSPIELEWAGLDDSGSNIEIECYLAHRKVRDEYRGGR